MLKYKIKLLVYLIPLLIFVSLITFTLPGIPAGYAASVSGMSPYLMGVTTDSVWVMVECDSATTSYVDFGTDQSYGSVAKTTSTQATGGSTYMHNIRLTGLQPNTTYHYRVRHEESTSGDYSFKTAVNPGTNFRFAFAADQRTGIYAHEKVALRIKAANPSFAIYAGDLCDTDTYTSIKNEFFVNNEKALLSNVPFFNAPGNHEGWTSVTKAFTSGPAGNTSNDPDFYSFDYGDAHFVMINTEIDFTEGSAQYNFVRDDLKASTKPWKIVFSHVPAYCAGGHGENPSMVAMSKNIFEPYGVNLVLSGHSHFYQSNLVNGVYHYIIGAGGVSPDNTISNANYTLKSIVDNCFGIIDVTPSHLHLDVFNEDGTKLDALDYHKSDYSPTAKPSPTPVPSPATIIQLGSSWKYLDNGTDQGTAWTDIAYDDSKWESGPAPLGYGVSSGLGTTVGFGPNSSNKYVTAYLRESFTVSNPSMYKDLNLKLVRDDGAVVYLNGIEVARSNMPSGNITSTTRPVTNGNTTTYYDYYINPSLLVAGKNILAVEVHQQSGSSDLFFDAELLSGVKYFNADQTPEPLTVITPTPGPSVKPMPIPTPGGDLLVYTATSDSTVTSSSKYWYWSILESAYQFKDGDYIEYDVYLMNNNAGLGGIDIICTDNTKFRSSTDWIDQNGVRGRPMSDISMMAYKKWYHRKLQVPASYIGKTSSDFQLAVEYNSVSTTYNVYYDNIVVTNNGRVVLPVYINGYPANSVSKGGSNYTCKLTLNDIPVPTVPRPTPTPTPTPTPVPLNDNIKVTLDGTPIIFDVPPKIINNRTMVPMRAIFEALGATITWDQKSRTVTGNKGNTIITLVIDNPSATVNGKSVILDAPAAIVDGRTLVPVRFISESLGTDVGWDPNLKTVTITTK